MLTYKPTPDWRFTAHGAWDKLSDRNDRRFVRGDAAYRFIRGRTDLRALASVEHLGYSTTTNLYFSPRSFWREDVGIEWRRRLTGLKFHGNRDRSLLARYLIGVDDRQAIYHTARFDLAYEFTKGLALTAQAQWIRSAVYNSSVFTLGIRLGGLAGPPE